MTHYPAVTGTKAGNMIVEYFTVKSNEDIEESEMVVNDGNGILAATTSHKGPFLVALCAHDYSEETDHSIPCGVIGFYDVQAQLTSAVKKGQYVEINASVAGEVDLFDYSSGLWSDVAASAMEDSSGSPALLNVLLG